MISCFTIKVFITNLQKTAGFMNKTQNQNGKKLITLYYFTVGVKKTVRNIGSSKILGVPNGVKTVISE